MGHFVWTPTPPGLLTVIDAETLFYLLLLYLISLLSNVSGYHLVNIQTKQYSRAIFSVLGVPCPKTPPCLETFVNLSLGIHFLINKESLIRNFLFSTHLALKLLSCFCSVFRKFGAVTRKLQYISLSMVHLPITKAKCVWNWKNKWCYRRY